MSGQYWPPKHAIAVGTGLVGGGLTGTVDDSVFQFAANARSGEGVGARIDVATTAANGTIVTALLKGLYFVELYANVPAEGNATLGISFNASAAALLATADPLNTLATIVAGLTATAPVAAVLPVALSVIIPVTADNIRNSTNLIRFHGTPTGTGGSGPIEETDVTVETVRYRVTYLGDLKGI